MASRRSAGSAYHTFDPCVLPLPSSVTSRSTTLSDVLAKLERRYGVNIHLNDSSLANDLFTGNFDSEYIVEVMDLLERHYDFTYDVRGDDIFIHP